MNTPWPFPPARAWSAAGAMRVAVYGFMLSMPWATVFLDPVNPHDGARMFQSLIMCLAAWAWARGDAACVFRPGRERRALIVLVVLAACSTLAADRLAYSGLEASAALLLAVTALVIARTSMPTLLRELPPMLALASLMSLLMELPRLVFFLADGRVPQASDFGFMYMNHRFLNHAESLILPLAFVPLLVRSPRWARVAAWIGLCGGLALLWRTGGRGTMIAVAVFAIALPWFLRARAAEVLRTLALAGGGAALVYVACFVVPPLLLGLPLDQQGSGAARLTGINDSARLYLWRVALDDVLRHPWLGIGPMHYAHEPNLLAAHPHNSVAQLAAEWGLPTTLLVLGAFGLLLVRCARALRSTPADADARALLAVGWLATVVGCIDSLVSGTLVMPVSQMWWGVALGCMLAAGAGASPPALLPSPRVRAVLALAAVAIHLGLSVVTYQRAVQPPSLAAPVPERNNVPRYWINGFF